MSSAGQLLGGIVGAVIGYFTGGPYGAAQGFVIGAGIGGALDQPDRYGPRLDDLRTQISSFGANIGFIFGTYRTAGVVIWPKILEAAEHEHSESAKGGPEQHTYTYTMSFAVLVCEGPIAGIRRIWANKRLVYDVSSANDGPIQDPALSTLRIYLGTDDQDPDPLIEAIETNTPAYRGYAYVVFEDYDVTELSGRVPQFEFEVITDGSSPEQVATDMGDGGNEADLDPETNYVWSVDAVSNDHVDIYITDVVNEVLVDHIEVIPSTVSASMGNDITYVDGLNEFWIANENGTDIIAVNPITYATREIEFGFSWSGLVHYCPNSANILVGTTNVAGNIYVIDGTGIGPPVATLTITGSVFAIDQIVTLENGLEAVLADGTIAVCFIDGAASVVNIQYTDPLVSTTAYMAADPSRNRLVIINSGDTSLIELDLDADAFTEHELVFPPDLDPLASTALRRILWHTQIDRYLVTAHQIGLGWTLYIVNPNDWSIETARVYSGPTSVGTIGEVPGVTSYFVYVDSGTNKVWKIPLSGTIDPNQVVLSDIVSALCVRSGLEESDIDVEQLDDMVDGYLVGRQAQARACIEPLQQAYFFDVVESDDKIKFIKRGQAVTVTTIPMNERAAREFGQDAPENLSIIRAADLELPFQCDVEYADIDADHLVGNQYERRLVKDTKQRVNLQLAIAMTAEKAKEVAKVNLFEAWSHRQSYKFTTTRKYAYLEPTDLVSLPTDSASYVGKIISKREQPNGVIEWEAMLEDIEIYSQDGSDAVSTIYSPQTIFSPDTTILRLLDIPILRDEDDNSGYYIAMGGEL